MNEYNHLDCDVEMKVSFDRQQYIQKHNLIYRGHELGYFRTMFYHNKLGFTPVWKGVTTDNVWYECSSNTDTVEDTIRLAKECIDYNVIVYGMEKILGRKLKWDELPKSVEKYEPAEDRSVADRTD